MIKFLRIMSKLIFVPRCAVCGELISFAAACEDYPGADILCLCCMVEFEKKKHERCPDCSNPCSLCACRRDGPRKNTPDADTNDSAGLFYYNPDDASDAGNRIIYYMKQNNDRRIFNFIGHEMALAIKNRLGGSLPANAVVCHIPDRAAAVNEKGFSHSRFIAQALSRSLGLELIPFLRRSADSAAQKDLDYDGRVKNAESAFSLNEKFRAALDGRTIILTDDVITSGAGMKVCAGILRNGGAQAVYCFCAAKTMWR